MSRVRLALWFATALFAAGCGGPAMSGKYSGTVLLADVSVEFQGSKVYLTNMGVTTEGTYTKDGDKIKILANGENVIFTLTPEGDLTGLPFGAVLKKTK